MKKLIILLLIVGISYGVDFGWQNGVPAWVKFGVAPTGTIDMLADTLDVHHIVKANTGIFSGLLQGLNVTATNNVAGNDVIATDSLMAITGNFTGRITAPTYTTSGATSYQYFASSAAADTVGFRRTAGAGGDYDFIWKYVNEIGTVRTWGWDDLLGWRFDFTFYAPDIIATSSIQAGNGKIYNSHCNRNAIFVSFRPSDYAL
jgi:hypothetical protein